MANREISEILTDEDIDELKEFEIDLKAHLAQTGFDKETQKEYFSVLYDNEINRMIANRIGNERNALVEQNKISYSEENVRRIRELKEEREIYYNKFRRTLDKVNEYQANIIQAVEDRGSIDHLRPQLPRNAQVKRLHPFVAPKKTATDNNNRTTKRR